MTAETTTIGMRRLYDLVTQQNWTGALDRCFSHPMEVTWQDEEGHTALHAAAQCSPPALMSALLRAVPPGCHPNPLALRTDQGETVLHIACSDGFSAEIIKLVLDADPSAASVVDKRERLALHGACKRDHGIEVLHNLLSPNPSHAACRDAAGRTPMSFLAERHRDLIEAIDLQEWVSTDPSACPSSNALVPLHLRLVWDKIFLLATAAYSNSMEGNQDGRLIRACAARSGGIVPPNFVTLVIRRNPLEVQEPDDDGNLPLHVAAAYKPEVTSDEVEDEVRMIVALLEAFPQGAQLPDGRGKLALDVAIDSGRTAGVKDILRPNVEAMFHRDVDYTLFPVLLADFGKDETPNSIFEMLTSNPFLLKKATIKV